MPTLSVYENLVRNWADSHNQYLSRADVRRAAKHMAKRQADVLDIDADLRILGLVSDPTPTQAVRNLNHSAAARRLGLA